MNIEQFKIRVNNEDFYFQAPIGDGCYKGTLESIKKNEYCFNKVDFKQDDVFIDIGCNVGIVSMVAAKIFPYIHIYSFEPNPICKDCMEEAIKLNNINNIQFFNVAVCVDRGKNIEFLTDSPNETCLIGKSVCENERTTRYFVDAISIYDIFNQFNHIRYLKCDIERGEFPIFNDIFDKNPEVLDKLDYLHIEIHPLEGRQESVDLRKKLDNKFGKRVFY